MSPKAEPSTTSVMVVEDQKTLAELLAAVIDEPLDMTCVGAVGRAHDGLRLAVRERPDVAVVDVCLPDMSGIELCGQLRTLVPSLRVVMLTAASGSELAVRAAAAGASAYLVKNTPLATVLGEIRRTDDSFTLDPTILRETTECRAGPPGRLSPRERQILDLMGEGLDARAIARRLHLSVHTTRGYIKSLYRKLDVHTQLEAVAVGIRNGAFQRGV